MLPLRGLGVSLVLAFLSLAPAAKADLLTANVPDGTAIFTFSGIPSSSGFADLNGSFYVGTLAGTMDGQAFPMYCVDLHAEIHPGDSYGVGVADVTTLSGYDLIGRLLSLAAPANVFQGAAMQLAIWDAEYFGGNPLEVPDASSGISISTSLGSVSDVFAQANDDLAAARTLSGSKDDFVYLQVPGGDYGQSMVTAGGMFQPASAVPEPSSILLVAIGGAAVAWRRRRSSR